MCGIVGYIGKNQAETVLLEGLRRLEYRGYDSSGIAILNSKIEVVKSIGMVNQLAQKIKNKNLSGNVGIAHTRWATHGKPSTINAHPHGDCTGKVWVVHNGIIENYLTIKSRLQKKGHKFVSETDTEVIAHLIEDCLTCDDNSNSLCAKNGSFEKAVICALKQIKGTYGLCVIYEREPNKIILARNGSPLILGVGQGEFIIASDASAIIRHTKKVVYLSDKEIAILTHDGFKITNIDESPVRPTISQIDWDEEKITKEGYSHFMLKEIHEAKEAVNNSTRGRMILANGMAKLGGLEVVKNKLRDIGKIIIISMGTARLAGLVGEYMIEEYAGIPVEIEYASEFRYRKPIIDKNTAVLAISQSGETADTLAAMREAKNKGALTLGIVNVVGSTIARETDAGVYNHIGPEIAVASTKAFISQITVLALMTVFLGRQREMSLITGKRILESIFKLQEQLDKVFLQEKNIKKLAKKYSQYHNFLFLGRKYNFPIALEGALKLKEVSYIHAEGYPTGEMKHGPIAMINKNFPSVFLALQDSVYDKVISGIQEIKARDGKVLAIATVGDKKIKKVVDDVLYIPKTLEMLSPILAVVPLQLFAYYIALELGHNVDKPRNLAKSVTVE